MTIATGDFLRRVRLGDGSKAPAYGWALGVEPEWLRLVLEVWAEAGVSS
jgi:hypothetical protein